MPNINPRIRSLDDLLGVARKVENTAATEDKPAQPGNNEIQMLPPEIIRGFRGHRGLVFGGRQGRGLSRCSHRLENRSCFDFCQSSRIRILFGQGHVNRRRFGVRFRLRGRCRRKRLEIGLQDFRFCFRWRCRLRGSRR